MIAGLVLAAGESTRFGGHPKPLVELDGLTLLARVCHTLSAGGIGPIRVVVGHSDAAVAAAAKALGAVVVENPDYRSGMLSSVRAGLNGLERLGAEAVLLTPVDHPMFRGETVRLLAQRFREQGRPIVLPCYRGRRGHPVLFAALLFEELRRAPDSVGARAVVQADPGRIDQVEVDDPGVLLDVDDPAALEEARRRLRAGVA
jgi:CTP:molybdopterin cytidylyltransferase MocA